MQALALSLDELWCIHRYVRRPREQEGAEFDKAFMLSVYRGIRKLEEEGQGATYDLECDDGALFQVTRLVDMDYCLGGKYTGRSLLLKVMRALTEEAPPDALLEEAMEVADHARDYYHHGAGTDDGTGDGAGATHVA